MLRTVNEPKLVGAAVTLWAAAAAATFARSTGSCDAGGKNGGHISLLNFQMESGAASAEGKGATLVLAFVQGLYGEEVGAKIVFFGKVCVCDVS